MNSLSEQKHGAPTQTILPNIPPNDSKLTYIYGQYQFHCISEGGFTYLVMADDSAGHALCLFFRAQTELNQVKDIMVQNVEQIVNRGERIELLVEKTDVMAGQATAFRRDAKSVRRQMWWKNTKVMAFCGTVALVFLWIFISQFCV
ncbi:VAMP/synaptobrevin-like protein [Roridomyces roridus]|uniref:Synaptobrevin homolog YKT6 n=1 Tax=Roridomyces roridus TaxID=1738132 RepID=A0AAD7C7W1_9AGAR|nr:VAMP/synaptobrevin-like protein [Roridomyces roridus]